MNVKKENLALDFVPLRVFTHGTIPTLDKYLDLSCSLAEALVRTHSAGVIHKGIQPDRVFVSHSKLKSCFSSIADPRGDYPDSVQGVLLEDSGAADDFAYMAPEQMGRNDARLDQRTDIYSLGVVLYEIACLHLPYEESDVTAWIHAHLAKDIIPPSHYNEMLPVVVSNILMKCLKKDPADRYQSAYGLYCDLQECVELYRQNHSLPVFTLAREDIQAVDRVFSKLWERTEQLHRLTELAPSSNSSYQRSKPSTALVLGESGSGKSALVDAFNKVEMDNYGFTVTVRCNSSPWSPRYGAVADAFRQIFRSILGQSEDKQRFWSARLERGLAQCKEFMVDLIPELELFLTPSTVKEFTEVTISQAAEYFLQLLDVVTEEDKSVLICMDDLQWIDETTLKLLRRLLGRRPRNATWVLSLDQSRLQDGGPVHEFLHWLQIRREVITVTLRGFAESTIGMILSRIFPVSDEDASDLAREIYLRTLGNPFLVRRWISKLQQRNRIWFDIDQKQWTWNLQMEDKDSHMEDSPALVHKMWELMPFLLDSDRSMAEILHWAAVVGRQFDVRLLASVSGYSPEEIETALCQSIEKQILRREEKHWKAQQEECDNWLYSFTHEQIRKEILKRLDSKQTSEMEYRVGLTLLRRKMDSREFPSTVLDIVDHLNAGPAAKVERRLLVHLNLWAGQQAAYLGKHDDAVRYFNTGLTWTDQIHSSENRSGIMYELRLGLANSRFMRGDVETAEKDYLLAFDRARNSTQKRHVSLSLLRLYVARGEFARAQALSASFSSDSGMQFARYGMEDVQGEIAESPTEQAKVLAKRGKFERAEEMLRAFLESPQARQNSFSLAEGYLILGAFVAPWTQSRSEAVDYLNVARDHAYASHDPYLCAQIDILSVCIRYAFGLSVPRALSELDDAKRVYQSMRLSYIESIFDAFHSGFRTLIENIPKEELDVEALNVAENLLRTTGNTLNLWFKLIRLTGSYLSGELVGAWQLSKQLLEKADASSVPFYGLSHVIVLHSIFLSTRLSEEVNSEDFNVTREFRNRLHRPKLESSQQTKDLAWIHSRAEQARLGGAYHQAADLYEQVSLEAQGSKLVLLSAIANERCAGMVLNRGKRNYARALYTAAIDDYYSVGAIAKAKQIEEEQAPLLRRGHGERRRRARGTGTGANGYIGKDMSDRIDWLMVSRAAQTLSREVVLDQLLLRLLKLMLESAAAQRGFILLNQKGELTVEAFASVDEPHPVVRQSTPLNQASDQLLLSVVEYTFRTGEDVIVDDAAVKLSAHADPYLKIGNPKSVLCIPMIFRKNIIGVLYLENNRMVRAFTESRLDFLKVLAAQAAISIENAFLYESLENQVADRTHALEESSNALAQANERLEQANEELRQADIMRRELLANVSHDLRTPITLIAGYAEAIVNGVAESEDEAKEFAHRIYDKTKSLSRLIEDLFNLVRLEAKQTDFELKPCMAEEFLISMAMHFQGDVERAGIEFRLAGVNEADITEDGTWIVMDRDRMEQVFSNIVYNAIKFTPAGGSIEIGLEKYSDKAIYYIHDTGAGIAQENLPHVFERFYKADKSRSRQTGGGLGLAIVKRIVDLHGGEISVSSKVGEGTTFTIALKRQTELAPQF